MLSLAEPVRPTLGGKGHVGVQIACETITVALPYVEGEHAINDEPPIPRRGRRSKKVNSPWPSFDFEAYSPAAKAAPSGSVPPWVADEPLPVLQRREPELIPLKVVGKFWLASNSDASILDRRNEMVLNHVKTQEDGIALVKLLAGLICHRHYLGQFNVLGVVTVHVAILLQMKLVHTELDGRKQAAMMSHVKSQKCSSIFVFDRSTIAVRPLSRTID